MHHLSKRKTNSQDLELYSTGYAKIVELGYGGWGFSNWDDSWRWSMDYSKTDHEMLLEHFKQCITTGIFYVENPSLHWLDMREYDGLEEEIKKRIEEKFFSSIEHRKILNSIYDEKLSRWALPQEVNLWRYNIFIDNPREIVDTIFSKGHFASRHYSSLVPAFGNAEATVAHYFGSHVVNLFNDHRYTEGRARELANIVFQCLK